MVSFSLREIDKIRLSKPDDGSHDASLTNTSSLTIGEDS